MTGAVIIIVVVVVLIGAALLLWIVSRRRQQRSRQITRTCITCDNLGASELCKPCNGSGEHWAERSRTLNQADPPGH